MILASTASNDDRGPRPRHTHHRRPRSHQLLFFLVLGIVLLHTNFCLIIMIVLAVWVVVVLLVLPLLK